MAELASAGARKRKVHIALGSHGRGAVQEMLTGSTFENVARLSHQPVPVVRHPPSERA